MSPSTSGICSRHAADQWERGQPITRTYYMSRKNYFRRPHMVERIGSYLPSEFPLFHGPGPGENIPNIGNLNICTNSTVNLINQPHHNRQSLHYTYCIIATSQWFANVPQYENLYTL